MAKKPVEVLMKRCILPPHPLPADAEEFLASLPKAERQLHMLAMQYNGLGSSYFMEKCHSYRAWKASRCSANAVEGKK